MRTLPAAAAALLLLVLLAGCAQRPASAPGPIVPGAGLDDVVVVAVLDTGFNPYHWDFLASRMPQATNGDPSDDLPLDRDPATWLPGHPGAAAFASYAPLTLGLDGQDKDAVPQALHDKDKEAWGSVKRSDPKGDIHLRWVPGTKVIGYVNFEDPATDDGFAPDSHGVGTTSVSVGNLHGTCPSCLLVFVNGLSDEAVTWVSQQDWIDVQTNSWGYSKLLWDKMWTGCDLEAQRAGVERGQQLFFSASNGMANSFDAPPSTLYSCQKGPDWIVAVGANTPSGASYTGHGKPADISSVGSSYPSAGGATVTADATFSGTSNATPVTAGLYAEALHTLRRQLAGPSRLQAAGTVAQGPAGCGGMNPQCALADGALTVHELREALFDAAPLLNAGTAAGDAKAAVPVGTLEWRYLNQGHGSLFGRVGDAAVEVQAIVDLADGDAVVGTPQAERLWNTAVSYCSQKVWGAWEHGAWREGTDLPPPDPQWPFRTWLVTECPRAVQAAVAAGDALPGLFSP